MNDLVTEAQLRHERHVGHPTHRPLSINYELVGLRGEEAFAKLFGCHVDLTPRPGGDKGKDATITVSFNVDIKTARKPGNLIVEEGKVKLNTIYILAGYVEQSDTAVLIGWQWGSVLLKSPKRDFGYGVINHYIPREQLRSIESLLSLCEAA
jgi:hypothetical protein